MAWPNTVEKKDLKIEFMRGSGKGGQNRNKRDTACRMTHILTGISVRAEEGRTQEVNRKLAFERLAAKLVPLMKAEILGQKNTSLPTERIRTYNEPRNQVVDHRTGKQAPMDVVLNGNIDDLR